jgi:formate hydrogenlyase subunit 4
MISYEVPMILSLLGVIMLAGSLSLVDIVNAQAGGFWRWYFLPQFPMFVLLRRGACGGEVCRSTCRGESEIVGGSWSSTPDDVGPDSGSEFASMGSNREHATLFRAAGRRR